MLRDLLPFAVSGLTVGSIYGLCGTGFVVTYKTSGIFNFAYPALAAIAAYVFWFLHADEVTGPGLPWVAAAVVSVLVTGPLLGLAMEVVARGLARVQTQLQVLATVGLLLGITGSLDLLYAGRGALPFDPYLPVWTFKLFGTYVGIDQAILFGVALGVVVVLNVFFRRSRMGVAMQAVVDNPPLLDTLGRSPTIVRRWAWVIGGTVAAASGVLLGPILRQLEAGAFLTIIVSSFGAAAVGGFTSLPLTFAGGLLIGIAGDVSTRYVGDVSWLAGLRGALPFLVLFVVLVARSPRTLAERRVDAPRPIKPSYYAPGRVRVAAAAVVVGALSLVPSVVGTDLAVWSAGLNYMMLFLSVGLLVKLSGQVSLCHTALAGVGGAAIAHATTDWGLPWPVAILFAGALTALVGLVIAVPAIRVSGVFLALATFGFGVFLQQMVYPTKLMFGGDQGGIAVARPSFASGDEAFYYLELAILVACALFMVAIQSGRVGRLAGAMSESTSALETMGTTVNMTKVSVFAISAFVAGIAGALYASASSSVYLGAPFFVPMTSLQLFAVVMLALAGTPWYGLIGGLSLQVVPFYVTKWFAVDLGQYLSLLFGLSAVVIALQMSKLEPMPAVLRRFCERFHRPPRRELARTAGALRTRPDGPGLQVRDLVVRFGGFVAVDHLTLEAPHGRITALIGPNGAGKTTTFNACSGLVRPAGGRILLDGVDISRVSPAGRARRGLGRTFQIPRLWPSLTVAENVALGREASMAGANLATQLLARRGDRARICSETVEAMALAGLDNLADRLAADLSTGEKRLVELARVLAGPFDVLLLDEPCSGLDTSEADRFGDVLLRVVGQRGTGILLVEHDMRFVAQICDYVQVVDFGCPIFAGTPSETMASAAVRAAYLGAKAIDTPPRPRAQELSL